MADKKSEELVARMEVFRESEARDLRVEISRLAKAKDHLERLVVLGDSWAEERLGEVEAAILEKTGRLSALDREHGGAAS